MISRVLMLVGPERVELREVPVPSPRAGELLLSVDAATTCGTDLKVFLRGGHPRMLRVPTPFGHEVAGTVAAVDAGVSRWREGDQVVVANSASCGTCRACTAGRENLCADLEYLNGTFADHLRVPERFVRRSTYPRPPGIEAAAAALAEPLACVLHGLSTLGSREPSTALVLGAGPIGLMFVTELMRLGHEVTIADVEPARLAAGRQAGARDAVRVLREDGDRELPRAALVVEATGRGDGWRAALRAVEVGGEVLLFGGCPPGSEVPLDAHRLHYSELVVRGAYHHRPVTFEAALARLSEPGCPHHRLIEARYPLEDVETALREMAARRILKAAIVPSLPLEARSKA